MKRLALLPLLALAACAGPARALECVGVVRSDGTVEWDDQYKSRPLRIAEHGSRCVDEGTNAMARGDGPVALERLEEAFRYLSVTPVRETETGAEAWTRLRESSFRFGCRMVDAATNAMAQDRQAEADDAFAAARRFLALCRTVDVVTDAMAQGKQEKDAFIDARRFLAVCRDSGEDDVRVRRIRPDYPMRCILLPASFTGAPEAFPFSAGKFLLWPSPEEGN